MSGSSSRDRRSNSGSSSLSNARRRLPELQRIPKAVVRADDQSIAAAKSDPELGYEEMMEVLNTSLDLSSQLNTPSTSSSTVWMSESQKNQFMFDVSGSSLSSAQSHGNCKGERNSSFEQSDPAQDGSFSSLPRSQSEHSALNRCGSKVQRRAPPVSLSDSDLHLSMGSIDWGFDSPGAIVKDFTFPVGLPSPPLVSPGTASPPKKRRKKVIKVRARDFSTLVASKGASDDIGGDMRSLLQAVGIQSQPTSGEGTRGGRAHRRHRADDRHGRSSRGKVRWADESARFNSSYARDYEPSSPRRRDGDRAPSAPRRKDGSPAPPQVFNRKEPSAGAMTLESRTRALKTPPLAYAERSPASVETLAETLKEIGITAEQLEQLSAAGFMITEKPR